MQITLSQDEIEHAIIGYVRRQITIAEDQKIEVDLKAGRGENGFTATLDIRPMDLVRQTPVITTELHVSSEDLKKSLEQLDIEETVAEAPVEEEAKPEPVKKATGLFAKAKAPETKSEEVQEAEAVLGTDAPEAEAAPKKIFNFGNKS